MNDVVKISEKDEITMKLVHYFITKENYAPIMVNGVKNEIWLENLEASYKIVRINSNYIHNLEQLEFDTYKINNVNKQISKKTLSRKMKTLNILTDANDRVGEINTKNIDMLIINNMSDFEKKDGIKSLFPNILDEDVSDLHGLDFLLNVTQDINAKTERDNKFYEKVFQKKPIVITKVLIAINIIVFILDFTNKNILLYNFALINTLVRNGEIYRLITSGFLHANIIHLFFNMYSLNILGTQIESFIGKKKYIFVYFISLISGSLLSCVVNNGMSIGASGAIFGLLGSLVYFGYHYRLYLGSVLKSQIIPILLFNLAIGFIIPGIDVAGHIGGLVGGILSTMAVGIEKKTNKQDRINGIICLIILLLFLIFLILK